MTERPAPASPMRPGAGSAIFIAVMLAASAMTMVRLVIVAYLLLQADFAVYATLVATGAFLSTIISFGAVEATIKAFPRLIGQGRRAEMLADSRRIVLLLILRAALTGAPLLMLGMLLGLSWLEMLGASFLFAFATGYSGLLASMQRAAGNPVALAAGTVLRASCVMLAVVAAAWFGGLKAVIATEAIATILACMLSVRLFFRREEGASVAQPEVALTNVHRSADGIRVFLGFTLISAPFYLDRLFVTAIMGAEKAGQYAVMAIFLTAASLLVNIIAQRVGPDVIRLAMQDNGGASARRLVLQWSGVTSTLWLAGMGLVAGAIALDFVPAGFQRYGIAPEHLWPLALTGILLNGSLLEFLLIALDRERAFLRCAIVFVALVLAGALAAAFLGWSLTELLWMQAGCRLAYVAALCFALPSQPATNMAGERD